MLGSSPDKPVLFRPLISVITVVKNGQDMIAGTLESVASQSYGDIEFIIVDGASMDGTVSIIEQHSDYIATWVSEPDHGIADAMNKGLALATGDFVVFLHAGDRFLRDSVVAAVVERIRGKPQIDIHGFCQQFGHSEQRVRQCPRGFTTRINLKTGFHHQATFCRRTLFDRIGGFDVSYRIAMDYEFFLRAYRAEASVALYDYDVAFMLDGGISSNRGKAAMTRRLREERLIHAKYNDSVILAAFYAVYWPLYLSYRGLRDGGLPWRYWNSL